VRHRRAPNAITTFSAGKLAVDAAGFAGLPAGESHAIHRGDEAGFGGDASQWFLAATPEPARWR
jgi:hypothetical protein